MKPAAMSLLAVILFAIPSTTFAKVPWHSVELVPAAPIAGEPLTVVIRFWDDGAHTQPSTWWPHPIEFQSAVRRVPLTLERSGDGTFHAEVALAEGTWHLVTVLQYSEISGPADVELATVTVAPAPSMAAPIGATVIGVALVTLGVIRRRRCSSSRTSPGRDSVPASG